MVPSFFFLKTRCYIAWYIAECCCIVNRLGAYPEASKPRVVQGPTDLIKLREINESEQEISEIEYSFETIKNVDPYGVEFSNGFRYGMRCWNRSVQYWLANCFYRRSPKSIRMPLTMLVSAFWHGIHPGYYFSFMTIPLCTWAEDLMFKEFGSSEDPKKPEHHNEDKNRLFDGLWWIFRTRGFEYMAMGFLLLSGSSTWRYWKSTGGFIHVLCIVFVVYCNSVPLFRSKTEQKKVS